jgi:hypothetical protein
MHVSKLISGFNTLALAGAAALLLSACVTQNEEATQASDGASAYTASEVDQMGQVYDQMGGEGVAAKTTAMGLTITGELVVVPFAYHEDCTCFVRHATFSGIRGYERERVDSVILLDSANAPMTAFKKAQVAKIIHKRNVTKSKGAKEADIRFDITVDIKTDAGVRKGVWNGSMTGSFNGQDFKSGSLVNVVRIWENGRFHFPESGIINLDRPVFTMKAEFLGDGKMKVTLTNKVSHKIHLLWVDKDYNETEPVEQA